MKFSSTIITTWLGRLAPDRARSVSLLLPLLLTGSLHAAEPPDPTLKLREQLRAVTLQLRTAQTESANAQAAAAAADQKTKDLAQKLSDLEKRNATLLKQTTADQQTARDTQAKLTAQLTQREQQLLQHQQAIQQWQQGYQKATATLQTTQQQTATLQTQLTTTRNTLADRERKNIALFNTANEILQRYQNHALGKALLAREPFIGTTRVKLENLVQGYQDKILDNRIEAPAR